MKRFGELSAPPVRSGVYMKSGGELGWYTPSAFGTSPKYDDSNCTIILCIFHCRIWGRQVGVGLLHPSTNIRIRVGVRAFVVDLIRGRLGLGGLNHDL